MAVASLVDTLPEHIDQGMSTVNARMVYSPSETVAELTSQWRVWPADSSVPTTSASAMTTVYLPESVTDELAGVIARVGASATSMNIHQD